MLRFPLIAVHCTPLDCHHWGLCPLLEQIWYSYPLNKPVCRTHRCSLAHDTDQSTGWDEAGDKAYIEALLSLSFAVDDCRWVEAQLAQIRGERLGSPAAF